MTARLDILGWRLLETIDARAALASRFSVEMPIVACSLRRRASQLDDAAMSFSFQYEMITLCATLRAWRRRLLLGAAHITQAMMMMFSRYFSAMSMSPARRVVRA